MDKLLIRIEGMMKVIAAAGLMAMALVTGFDIIGRTGWNTPIYGSEEMVSILAVLVMGLSLPYAHTQGSHIGVEVLFRRLPAKARRITKLITEAASCALFAVVAWRLVVYGLDQNTAGVVTMNLALPFAYPIMALGICFGVFSLFLLLDTVKTLFAARG
jgi:TRAP-type transport system small permease protein